MPKKADPSALPASVESLQQQLIKERMEHDVREQRLRAQVYVLMAAVLDGRDTDEWEGIPQRIPLATYDRAVALAISRHPSNAQEIISVDQDNG